MPQQQRGPYGSRIGQHDNFDDGALDFYSVRSVAITVEQNRIVTINVNYMKGSDVQEMKHGLEDTQAIVEIGPFGAHQGYIISVGGTYKRGTVNNPTGYISSLYFVTSRGTKSIFGAATKDFDEESFYMTTDINASWSG